MIYILDRYHIDITLDKDGQDQKIYLVENVAAVQRYVPKKVLPVNLGREIAMIKGLKKYIPKGTGVV